MIANYDFQQQVGVQVSKMIYFKIVSESRRGRKSIKQLTGVDTDGNTYTAQGIIDATNTLTATNVQLVSQAPEKLGTRIMTDDGNFYIITDDGTPIITE